MSDDDTNPIAPGIARAMEASGTSPFTDNVKRIRQETQSVAEAYAGLMVEIHRLAAERREADLLKLQAAIGTTEHRRATFRVIDGGKPEPVGKLPDDTGAE